MADLLRRTPRISDAPTPYTQNKSIHNARSLHALVRRLAQRSAEYRTGAHSGWSVLLSITTIDELASCTRQKALRIACLAPAPLERSEIA
jgi:hypothetical protein